MKQYVITPRTTTPALLAALFAAAGLLVGRAAKNTLTALKRAKVWLTTSHRYDDGDGGVIVWTGWQYIGFGTLVCVVCLLLCVRI